MKALTAVLFALGALAAAFAAYHRILAPPSIAVVDAAALWQAGQANAVRRLARPDVGESDRRAALDDARRFGDQMQAALGAVSRECGCTLLSAAALLSGGGRVPDYTAAVASRLGLSLAGGDPASRPSPAKEPTP